MRKVRGSTPLGSTNAMPEKINRSLSKIISSSFFLLFFLVPIFFLPLTSEIFEINKMLLSFVLGVTIFWAWASKAFLEKNKNFEKTPLFWPLLIFWFSQGLATVFSIHPRTSLLGYYTRLNGGLFSLTLYLFLYFAFINNSDSQKTKKLFLGANFSALFLVCSYGILQHYGIDDQFWVQDVKRRVFSTLGQPNWLAAWIDALIFLPLFFASNKSFSKNKRLKGNFLFIISFVCLLFTRSRSGLLAFLLIYPLFWLILSWLKPKRERKEILPSFLFFSLCITFLILIIEPTLIKETFSPFSPASVSPPSEKIPLIEQGGSPSEEIRKTVWQGALELGKKYPLLGTGPETFAYAYYWVRPKEHNLLSEWDFLYNKAHNEYLNYLATSGCLGLLAYLGFILAFIIIYFQKINRQKRGHLQNEDSFLTIALFCGFLTILITNFFGFSVVAVNLLFYLIPAFIFSLFRKENNHQENLLKTKNNSLPKEILFLLFVFLLFSYFLIINYWLADYHFNKAEKHYQEGQYLLAKREYDRARQKAPREPLYQSSAALNAASLALIAASQERKTLSEQFSQEAFKLGQEAIKNNPYHLNLYRQYAQTLFLLGQIDPQYLSSLEKVLSTAQKLAPTDPKITYNLGVLASRQGEKDEAINWLEQTINLKPNYETARLALAKIYQQTGEKEKAEEQLKYLLQFINPQNEEAQKLLEGL